jgi:hypothetical protein
MTATPHTDPAQLEIARGRFQTDWDADGTVSVHLPTDVAERLLAERGWNLITVGRSTGWESPDGFRYWHTDEALALALTAENS